VSQATVGIKQFSL